jgi:hypothetical protein
MHALWSAADYQTHMKDRFASNSFRFAGERLRL